MVGPAQYVYLAIASVSLFAAFALFYIQQLYFALPLLIIAVFCFFMCFYTAKNSYKPGKFLVFFGCTLFLSCPVISTKYTSFLAPLIQKYIPFDIPINPTTLSWVDFFIGLFSAFFVLAGIKASRDSYEHVESAEMIKNRVQEKK